jgi:hypothetical protein
MFLYIYIYIYVFVAGDKLNTQDSDFKFHVVEQSSGYEKYIDVSIYIHVKISLWG